MVLASGHAEEQKKSFVPVHTRTELKVSRSLNPDATQTLNVVTKDGNVAQLIVKRKNRGNNEPSNFVQIGSSQSDNQRFVKPLLSSKFHKIVVFVGVLENWESTQPPTSSLKKKPSSNLLPLSLNQANPNLLLTGYHYPKCTTNRKSW